MNAFDQYAEQAIPPSVQRRQAKHEAKAEKPVSALDLKMAEKQRLSRLYKIWQRSVREEALNQEPRLRDFMRYLRTVTVEQGGELIEQVRGSWLPRSAQSVRIFALRAIDRRAGQLARSVGYEALDDPLPPETSVYFQARDILHKGGRA